MATGWCRSSTKAGCAFTPNAGSTGPRGCRGLLLRIRVPFATIRRDLPGFIGAGRACGLSRGKCSHGAGTEIHIPTATALKRSGPKQLPPPNNHALGFKADLRAFSLAAAILHDPRVPRVQALSALKVRFVGHRCRSHHMNGKDGTPTSSPLDTSRVETAVRAGLFLHMAGD